MRDAGVLLAVTSLPSPFGIGCMSREAYRFVDFLVEAGQKWWQILPIGPTGFGDSPYQSFSAFAGNPYWIDLEELIDEGLLSRQECLSADLGADAGRVDYGKIYNSRMHLLRLAFERSRGKAEARERAFLTEQGDWLSDYALFMACKHTALGAPLGEWEEPFRRREESALQEFRENLREEIDFHIFLQTRFFDAWRRLRAYANERGIGIVGDLPIYVSADSADVWCHPELFWLDDAGRPVAVAGCPPDEFSETGQLWGNPLYNWEAHERTGYEWWIRRLRHAFDLYDAVRIDHFRGFDEFYAVDVRASTAADGKWMPGPGMKLFSAVKNTLGERDVIAEDLGFVTDSVRELVRESGFDGMKVLQLGMDSTDGNFVNEYLPHCYPERSAAYTGTHDNPTLRSWIDLWSREEEAHVRAYLCDRFTPKEALCEPLIGLVMRSAARRCIVPIQDYLELGAEGCMNRPSTEGDNWKWRLRADQLNDALKEKIRRLTAVGGRL